MTVRSSLSHRHPLPLSRFLFGAAYYPEHWDGEMLSRDAERMRKTGLNLVRMGEFAWHLFEPEEGRFEFAWLDDVIHRLAEEGIQTMLCTPTAAPPRWLTHAYPEVLRQDGNGIPLRHGSRQHASHFSSTFRDFSRRITRELAEHYLQNPHVVGWQTDNEFHCHFAEDHSPAAQEAFREYLAEAYQHDIQALNRVWGADFWAMAYQTFEQIETPVADRPTHLNPSQVLDYHRFLSWGVSRFQREQVEILRAANPEWWVTHNGCFASIDYRGSFSRDLDFLSYDSYPFFDPDPANRCHSHAFNLDYVRAYAGHFMIPEQQSGPGGQTQYLHDTPEPGEMRRMALASIAHGADALLFFRWRSCRFGAEEYWCGLLDHDNRPGRRLMEAGQLGEELKRLGPELMGSSVRIDVAVAGADFDSQYAHQALHHGLPGPRQAAEEVHGVLHARNHAVGIVHPDDDLSGVKVYIVPHLPLWKAEWIPSIKEWVREGGTLVIGPRCGSKDLSNQVISDPLPGCLRELTGTRVAEYGRQNRPDLRPHRIKLGDHTVSTDLWYDVLEPDEGTHVAATWDSRYLMGRPAVTVRPLGAGRVVHVGAWMTADVTGCLLDWMEQQGWLVPGEALPQGIERVDRVKPDGTVLRFLLNHSDMPVQVALDHPATDLLQGRLFEEHVSLAPNDVVVLKNT